MSIQTIGIIGAGTMGNGIAQACSAAGLQAVLQDVSEPALARAMSRFAVFISSCCSTGFPVRPIRTVG